MKGFECMGQYLYFPGYTCIFQDARSELTKSILIFCRKKAKEFHSLLYTTFDLLCPLVVARTHVVVAWATNRLMHGGFSPVQDIPPHPFTIQDIPPHPFTIPPLCGIVNSLWYILYRLAAHALTYTTLSNPPWT